jgi:AAA15 family ATPase/GTPase
MAAFEDNQTISFKHRGQEGHAVSLPIGSESDGTLAYLAMLGPVVEILATGGVLCVDELDASLHPLLVGAIVRLFNRIESNPRGAQLIFNTHDTELLNGHLFDHATT